MTRTEHLAWAKRRALAYCDVGDGMNAFASMASDLGKHPETAEHPALELGFGMLIFGSLKTIAEMRKFIEGFN